VQLCSSITAVDFEGTKIFKIRLLLHAVKNAAKRYIAFGGDSYSMIVTKDFSTGSDLGYDIFSDYVKRYSQIFTGIEDRISFSTITKPSNFGSINKSHTSF
jgi:hypothetical protein